MLLNNLESKHSLLIQFVQFMLPSKINNFIKKFYKNCDRKSSSRPFCVCKELSTVSIGRIRRLELELEELEELSIASF